MDVSIVYNLIVSLIESLQKPDIFDHPVTKFEVLETHISWVLLTGAYAYKIKKPVNFGFVDFSTLQKRQHFCQEEIRLNRRLAPQIYIDVVEICGTIEQPRLNAGTAAIEYAVKMRQFDQACLLPNVLAQQGIAPGLIDELANTVAHFHQHIAVVPTDSPYGDSEHISQPVLENFSQIRHNLDCGEIAKKLDELATWSKEQLQSLRSLLDERKANGYVRECHGDMHLRNMALIDNKIVIFDCIEFNMNFYFIDVISEIAFLVMDLEERDQAPLARRFLNQYLECTGDYAGLMVFNFYKVYRAMVRAKVDALRASQETPSSPEYQQTWQDFLGYLALAKQYTGATSPCLLINHGLSGSGKSHVSKMLLEYIPVIVLRSDVERKRIHGIGLQQHTADGIERGLYSREATDRTYQHLVAQARILLKAGYSVIIDAANLKYSQRQLFIGLARAIQCPAMILHYQAGENVLRQRITDRLNHAHDISDATLDVLDKQLETVDALTEEEDAISIKVNTERSLNIPQLVERITKLSNHRQRNSATLSE